ncbi:MAG: tryptophan 7-halogenase [Verrucomicrobiales bacterium]|nr:tryptophan 7-halogenase [Verrucomicrobiales bacterium]
MAKVTRSKKTERRAVSGSEQKEFEKSILVVGGGSAGFLAAITLKARMPVLDVTVIHSSDIPIIGVGEGTTLTMPVFLHGYLGIDPHRFHREVKPTYKLGIRFEWGPRDQFYYTFSAQLDKFLKGMPRPNGFYAFEDFEYADLSGALAAQGKGFLKQKEGGGPVVNTDLAYHLENVPFVRFLEKYAAEIGVNIIDDKILEVQQDEDGVSGLQLESGNLMSGDLYIDCSGFASLLLGDALGEPMESYDSSLFCNKAVIGGWERKEEPLLPYTTAETMDAGWAWRIEHDDIINRGYVFGSDFISENDAEEEFRKKNPKVKDTRVIGFDSGARKRTWVKNVVALGNSAGFVEPLEATALAVICEHAAKLIHCLADSYLEIDAVSRDFYNRHCNRTWQDIRRFLALHYKYNTRIDTEFWRACQNDTDIVGAEEIIDYYRASGPSLLWGRTAMGPEDPFTWEGYLVMMVGQKVPFERSFNPKPEEWDAWRDYQKQLKSLAKDALTMREGLDMIRSDNWRWHPDFYKNAARW